MRTKVRQQNKKTVKTMTHIINRLKMKRKRKDKHEIKLKGQEDPRT